MDFEAWIAELWTRDCHECVRVRTYPYTAAGFVAAVRDGAAWARGRMFKRSPRAWLCDARYALPGWIERHVARENARAAARRIERLQRPVSASYFQASSAAPARPVGVSRARATLPVAASTPVEPVSSTPLSVPLAGFGCGPFAARAACATL